MKFLRCILFVNLALGFLWALGHAYSKLHQALYKSLEGIDLELTGQIVSFPSIQGCSTRFDFLVHEASKTSGSEQIIVPEKVRLNRYGKAPELLLNVSWQLHVRLKRQWGFENLGSFDY